MTTSKLLLSTLFSSLLLTACTKKLIPEGEGIQTLSANTQGIINGEKVTDEEDLAKTTVQVFTFNVQEDFLGRAYVKGISNCTGTILDHDILLTAAHCTSSNPGYMALYFSTESPKDMREFMETMEDNPQVRWVVGGKVGNRWPYVQGELSDWGDIALLKFEGGIPEGYQTASLLPAHETLQPSQPITLAGYGVTNGVENTRSGMLLKVDVSILKPEFSPTEMVIDSGEKGPCRGDSGGPAYVIGSDGRKYVAGVTSRAEIESDPKALCIGDTIYTKVQPYADWIATTKAYLQSAAFKPEEIPQPHGM